MAAPSFSILPEFALQINWNTRGSCGEGGCTDPECCCSLCARPIGVSENDPRWDEHDEWCDDCDLCRDRVPLILFRGEGQSNETGAISHAVFRADDRSRIVTGSDLDPLCFLGKLVVFNHLPDSEPTCVTGVTFGGMLEIESLPGQFAPHLFIKVGECTERLKIPPPLRATPKTP
jgi:hypothetical protein